MSEENKKEIDIEEIEKNNGEDLTSGSFSLELGDIIEIVAPNNSDYNSQTFYILYIDPHKIKLINVATFQLQTLNIDADGTISDESITEINLINRSQEKGYARQNGLLTGTWVDIHFGGEIPMIITGHITNLENDEIEITTYSPINDIIFINFEYQGIPEDIPIEKIVIRDAPAKLSKETERTIGEDLEEETMGEEKEASITYTDSGESIIKIPDGVTPDENIRETLQSIYLDANELFGEDLMDIIQTVEIPEEKQYGANVQIQLNQLTDEFLSTIPNSKRNDAVMNRIRILLERFKEVRTYFSEFDENGNVANKKIYGLLYKPIIPHIINLDKKLKWLLPVVTNNKNIYVKTTELNDVSDYTFINNTKDLTYQETNYENYKNRGSNSDESRYDTYIARSINNLSSFSEPHTREDLLDYNREVKQDLEAIVNNLDDFYSTTIKHVKKNNYDLAKFKYLVQRYSLGATRIHDTQKQETGEKITIKRKLTSGDKMNIKSLLVMPEQIMRYSRIDLPGTTILERCQLSTTTVNYFQLLHKKKEIKQTTISNLDKQISFAEDNREDSNFFLKEITEFVLDDNLMTEDEKYRRFLEVIIPETRKLIQYVRDDIKNKFSFIEIVKYLEPFLVYSEHINYGQYNEIRYTLKHKIKELRMQLSEKSTEYSSLLNNKHNEKLKENHISRAFFSNKEIYETFINNYLYKIREEEEDYKKEIDKTSPSEMLNKILNRDYGLLYSNLMSFMLLSLVTPDKLLETIEKADIENLEEKIKDTNNCSRRFLTKKYKSIEELQKDNNVEDLFYDKEYDDTPYSIIKKYDKERKEMLAEKFVGFLAENLVQKHDCPRHLAKEMAETLISGKKKVKDGEYAVLILYPKLPKDFDVKKLTEKEKDEIRNEAEVRTKYHYYKRQHGHWVRDPDISEDSFLDNNALFCNIDFNCHKNPQVNTCDPENAVEIRLKHLETKTALNEFDRRFNMTVEQMMKLIESRTETYKNYIRKMDILRENELTKYSFIAYEIGKYAITDDIIVSPYAKLYDMILSQDDFTKKQNDICKFVSMYCRDNFHNEPQESEHWLYCKETSAKLVPRSIYILAETFIGGGDYQQKQEELCYLIGELSDDGDSWVDKHCGIVLRRIDFVAEQGYDEAGFKINTHSIMQKDLGTVLAESLTKMEEKERKVFEDQLTDLTHSVFYFICKSIDIDHLTIEDFVMRIAMEIITDKKILMTEESYNKKAAKIEKEKGKPQAPYQTYKNQTIIAIVGAVIIVGIQTVIPGLKIKKTFPGCVASFGGYPLEGGEEDMSGIKYIACVINKTKSSVEPWNSIQKLTSSVLEKRIKTILDEYIIPRNEINELYLKKREYILLNPDEFSVKEHSIQKWKHFLPPIVDINISKSVHSLSNEHTQELLELIKKGHKNTHAFLNNYRTKIRENTFAIVESINDILSKKDTLLKTVARIPFVDNACCNEGDHSTHPISYFIEDDANIDALIKRSHKNEIILRNVKAITGADYLFNNEDTRLKRPILPTEFHETNIYSAFIHYCNFDNDLPIPKELLEICSQKPDNGYDRNWPIEEKVHFLKRFGRSYTIDNLYELMTIVNNNNLVSKPSELSVFPIMMFTDALNSLEEKDSNVIAEPLRKLLFDVLGNYNPKQYISESDKSPTPINKALTKLRNYVIKSNDEMHKTIMNYFDRYGNISKPQYDKIQKYILELTNWQSDISIKNSGLYYDNGLFTVTNFIKNHIYNTTQIYPNEILNNVFFNKVHAHWGLSRNHMADITKILNDNSEELNKFKKDKTIFPFLRSIPDWAIDIHMFINHIPVYTSIYKDGEIYFNLFDKRTIYLLYAYCWYSMMYEMVRMTDNKDLLELDIKESKNIRKKNIDEKRDLANVIEVDSNIGSSPENDALFEITNEIMDIEIIAGNSTELKKNVASLLISILQIEMKDKNIIDLKYEDYVKNVKKTKEQEKKSIIDFLENMEKDELNIEKMLKKYKMERWNTGLQKSNFIYDAKTYDANRDTSLVRLYDEFAETNDFENVQDEGIDVNALDAIQEEENAEYDNEGFDIGGLTENYADGEYYEEDVDRDFGYDD